MKTPLLCWLAILSIAVSSAAYAQESVSGPEEPETSEIAEEVLPTEAETEAPESGRKFFFTISEGATTAWLTRIIKQEERSNFVDSDFLLGLYVSTELHNIPHIIPSVRAAVYYPLITKFNDVPQKPKTPLHFGTDVLAMMKFEILDFQYVRLLAGPGLHLFFLSADRWNYVNLGGALTAGVELPLTARWTLLLDGYVSLDSGNLGSNRLMEPYDITYQYQADLGVRYSKKMENAPVIFAKKDRRKDADEVMIMVNNEGVLEEVSIEETDKNDENLVQESEPLRR